jgi:hypothetical protein
LDHLILVEDKSRMVEPSACEKRWAGILASFQRNLDNPTGKIPESVENIKLLHAGLVTIGQLIQFLPHVNGSGTVWTGIVTRAEAERAVLCKHLEGKTFFAGMIRLHAATHAELMSSLKTEEEETSEEFCEQEAQV